jgi:MOSC domain-containing protein
MYVAELWRYPVKSLGGEPLEQAELSEDGIAGDRLVHVRHRHHVLTGRTRPGLLTLKAETGQDGKPVIDGLPWDSAQAAAAVRTAVGHDAELVRYEGGERFDVLPLLVATDGAIKDFGYGGRRLRPNLVIAGVHGLAERTWPGKALRIGDALIGVESRRGRCIVTTINPDTGEQDLDVLRTIQRRYDGKLALNCWVAEGGLVRRGDPVEVVDADLPCPPRGGWILGRPYLVP